MYKNNGESHHSIETLRSLGFKSHGKTFNTKCSDQGFWLVGGQDFAAGMLSREKFDSGPVAGVMSSSEEAKRLISFSYLPVDASKARAG